MISGADNARVIAQPAPGMSAPKSLPAFLPKNFLGIRLSIGLAPLVALPNSPLSFPPVLENTFLALATGTLLFIEENPFINLEENPPIVEPILDILRADLPLPNTEVNLDIALVFPILEVKFFINDTGLNLDKLLRFSPPLPNVSIPLILAGLNIFPIPLGNFIFLSLRLDR